MVVPLIWESPVRYSKWYAKHTRQHISHTDSMLGTLMKNFRKIKLRSDQPELVTLVAESMEMMREYTPVRKIILIIWTLRKRIRT
ncbi:hypothetical protein MLD38_027887 [Melastoma candidum]|uniref:Uncharacterized protein n=1 Tax=Melastoma candidum TaxID=119954 RepID=A0ACB9MZH3_9MYRT|nr:hypothetical protein MLD38_027887 [Melastoma candidum]